MFKLRPVVQVCCVIIFLVGLFPPESKWLMGIGLAGFFAAFLIPKDF